jgi:hypothetical protein
MRLFQIGLGNLIVFSFAGHRSKESFLKMIRLRSSPVAMFSRYLSASKCNRRLGVAHLGIGRKHTSLPLPCSAAISTFVGCSRTFEGLLCVRRQGYRRRALGMGLVAP